MQLSIRNRWPATVVSVTSGEAMSTVKAQVGDGAELTAAITSESATDLGLSPDAEVLVLVKSTDVSLAVGEVGGMSIRNRLPGTVSAVARGAAMSTVQVDLAAGGTVTAAVTNESVDDLGLAPGVAVTALVKSTDVSVARP